MSEPGQEHIARLYGDLTDIGSQAGKRADGFVADVKPVKVPVLKTTKPKTDQPKRQPPPSPHKPQYKPIAFIIAILALVSLIILFTLPRAQYGDGQKGS